MKTYVTYGLVWALAGSLLTFALFFLGYHSVAEKLQTGNTIAIVGGIIIGVICLVLGTKARQREVPLTEPFGYGRALAAGVMITIFATVFGAVINYVYMNLINPGMTELTLQVQIEKFEQSGMNSAQIEGAEAMMRKMAHPLIQGALYIFGGMFFGVLLALFTSIFVRRPAAAFAEPPVQA